MTDLAYDLLPYMNQPYAQSHPDRLATVATLFGLKPARVECCRVLELGCAAGGNLIPMGLELPESGFVGIDLSPRQVGEGQKTIDALGLTNVELKAASILDVDDSYGQFDFIIAHGVYSWVPQDVRQKMLEIYQRNLTSDGIGYISFNTLPGWHMRGMIRDMMRYHVSRYTEAPPTTQVAQARGLLDFLAQSVQGGQNPYAMLLRQEFEVFGKNPDAYVFHEQLGPTNDAFYLYQFAEHLAAHGLRYIGESVVSSMGTFDFTPEVRETLCKLATTQIEMEQYLDFLVNRTFRETVICRAEHRPVYSLTPERVRDFQVASMLRPQNAAPNLAAGASEVFLAPDESRVETKDAIGKSALMCLRDRWPHTLGFDELRRLARERLQPGAADDDETTRKQDSESLGTLLLHCYVNSLSKLVEFWQCAPRFVIEVSCRPVASPLARLDAPRQDWTTTMRHEIHRLSALPRLLLPLLDGTRDRAALLDELVKFVMSGQMNMQVESQPVTDCDTARKILESSLEHELIRLARSALLVG